MATKQPHEKLEQELQEELAGILIAGSLGPGFRSVHIGSQGDTADCEIHSNDALFGLLEVTSDRDGNYERLLKEVLAEPGGEHLGLPVGYGAWSCEMECSAQISNLNLESICSLLDLAISTGLDDIRVDDQWPRGELLDRLTELHLRSLHRISWTGTNSGDYIFRHLPSEGGAIDSSPDLIAAYSESFLERSRTTEKLEILNRRANGLKRYFCVITGSGSDYSVRFRMNGIGMGSPVPNRGIVLPTNLDVFWIMSMSTARVLRFSSDDGWTEHVRPAQGSPWWHFENLPRVREMNALVESYMRTKSP